MLEKRTMWYVNKKRIQDEAEAVITFFNTETQKAEFFIPDDDVTAYELEGHEFCFSTKEEAEEARVRIKHELIDQMPAVREYLDTMQQVLQDEDENSFFRFKGEDYLGDIAYLLERSQNKLYTYDEYKEVRDLANMLGDYIDSGTINIKGTTIFHDDVKRIEWGNGCARLVLTDGTTLTTSNGAELLLVKRIFGCNYSDFTYTSLNKK